MPNATLGHRVKCYSDNMAAALEELKNLGEQETDTATKCHGTSNRGTLESWERCRRLVMYRNAVENMRMARNSKSRVRFQSWLGRFIAM